jgi:endonuclease G, mitochondrial
VKKLLIILFLPNLIFAQSTALDLNNYEDYMPTSSCGEIIDYNYYSVSFCEDYRLSEWAIYYMTPDRIGSSKRKNDFRIDPEDRGASLDNYKHSGFDRGHLVPAADMTLDDKRMSQTFFMTNITPQTPSFNRGILRQLESQIRSWIFDFDTVVIITGWFSESSENKTIGDGELVVPDFFYKVFIDIQQKRSIAFILPNEKGEKSLFEYVCSIEDLEEKTGLDFFYKLPDDVELSFESESK